MVDTLHVSCPSCRRTLKIGRNLRIPFVVLRILCECGTVVSILHPRYTEEDISRLKVCCDCGDPIPVQRRGNHSKYSTLSRTCPICWERHRQDESGEDIGRFLKLWVRPRWPVLNRMNPKDAKKLQVDPPPKPHDSTHRNPILTQTA
jgi:hypothetical protein